MPSLILTAIGAGVMQNGDKAAHVSGLVKELEAAREEAASLRARLPGLLHLSTVVEQKDAIIKTLHARLAEAEAERDEERRERSQRQAEGEHRETELRSTLQDRDGAIELLTTQVGPDPIYLHVIHILIHRC